MPLTQKKNKLIHAMFDTQTKFQDSLFYDVSAWTFPLAFNLNYSFQKSTALAGEEIDDLKFEEETVEQSSYAYLLESNGYYTPKFIYELLEAGVRVKVGLKPFSIDGNSYDYGSIMIPVGNQQLSADELYDVIKKLHLVLC